MSKDKYIIHKISNNEELNLKELNIDELYKLHFEEEKYSASKLKLLPPFSQERYDFLNKSYNLIEKIKDYRSQLENKKNISTTFDKEKILMFSIFLNTKKRIKKKAKKLVVLELGCGKGKLLEKLSDLEDLKLYGCDLHPNLDLNKKIIIYKDTILNTLNNFDDNSIDILIADNVCEHFFMDEAETIYKLINKKLNKNGKIIFAIPNINVGPNDISRKFLKMGEKAVGFHFMEQTYKQNITMFKKYGLITNYLCLRKNKKSFFIYNFMNIPDTIKILMEKYLAKLKEEKRKNIFRDLGYSLYILKKKK